METHTAEEQLLMIVPPEYKKSKKYWWPHEDDWDGIAKVRVAWDERRGKGTSPFDPDKGKRR